MISLTWSASEMWGRVSGARAFAISTLPAGNILAGLIATYSDATKAVIMSSLSTIAAALVIAKWAPQLSKRE